MTLKYHIENSVCKFTDNEIPLCDIKIIPIEQTTKCEQPFKVEINFLTNKNIIGNWEFEEPIFYCEPNNTGEIGEYRINMRATNRKNQIKEDFYVLVLKKNFTYDNCLDLIAKLVYVIGYSSNSEDFDEKTKEDKQTCMNRVKQII